MIYSSALFPVGKVLIQILDLMVITASLEHRLENKNSFLPRKPFYICVYLLIGSNAVVPQLQIWEA